MCHFFATKATPKEESEKNCIKRTLSITFYLFFFLFGGLFIYQWIMYTKMEDTLCRTVAFILPEMFNCLISVMFIGVGFQIQSHSHQYFEAKIFNSK